MVALTKALLASLAALNVAAATEAAVENATTGEAECTECELKTEEVVKTEELKLDLEAEEDSLDALDNEDDEDIDAAADPLFQAFDADQDGLLSPTEVGTFLGNQMWEMAHDMRHGKDTISIEEYLKPLDMSNEEDKAHAEAIRGMDKDADGVVTKEEYIEGIAHSADSTFMQMFDRNQNGSLEPQEFMFFTQMMMANAGGEHADHEGHDHMEPEDDDDDLDSLDDEEEMEETPAVEPVVEKPVIEEL